MANQSYRCVCGSLVAIARYIDLARVRVGYSAAYVDRGCYSAAYRSYSSSWLL